MRVPPFALARPVFVIALTTGLLAGCGGGGSGGGTSLPIAGPPAAATTTQESSTSTSASTAATSYIAYADTMAVGALPDSNAVLKNVNGALSISDASFGTVNLVPDGRGGYQSSPPFTQITVSGAVPGQPVIGLCQKNAALPTFVDSKFLLVPRQATPVSNPVDLAGVRFAVDRGASAGCEATDTAFSFSFRADGSLVNESADENGDSQTLNFFPDQAAQLLNTTFNDEGSAAALRVYKFADGRFLLIAQSHKLDHPDATDYIWVWSH